MPYEIDWSFRNRSISEQKYAYGGRAMFTNIDSCIGIVAKYMGGVVGVHLVMLDRNGNWFDQTGVRRALEVLGCMHGRAFIIGDFGGWQQNFGVHYTNLVNGLGGNANVRQIQARGNGLGGRTHLGHLQYRANGVWQNA